MSFMCLHGALGFTGIILFKSQIKTPQETRYLLSLLHFIDEESESTLQKLHI